MRFAPFFFFLNFGLTWPFQPIQADTADTDRVGPIWAASAPISAASARFGNRHMARRGTDARSAASLPRRRVGRRCAGLGAASVHPSLKVINKFYTKAKILFINCCLTIAYAGVTLFRSKIHLLLQACFPNFMVGSEGSLRPIPNLDRDHINHSDKLRIFDIIKRNGTS